MGSARLAGLALATQLAFFDRGVSSLPCSSVTDNQLILLD